MAVTKRLMQGNQAIAEGAFYAGARFYAGYPITPSSEIAEACSVELPRLGGVFLQMEDEIASIAAVIGASLAGAKAFTTTSGPGFSLMQENLGLAIMGEMPYVIVNVQRTGPSTGLTTKPGQSDIMQVRWGRHGDQTLIALCPASVAECFSLTVQAFNFAERFRVPVVLMPDKIVGHMRESMVVPAPDGIAPIAPYGSEYIVHVTSSMHGRDGYSNNDPANAQWRVGQLHEKLARYHDEIVLTRSFDTQDMEVLLVTLGAITRAGRAAARQAREEGLTVIVCTSAPISRSPSSSNAFEGERPLIGLAKALRA